MVGVVLLGIGVVALAPSIDTSKGYHESEQVSVSVSGVEKTLQEAIDDNSLGKDIPSGAVMAFNLAGCPSGWSTYTPAKDRVIVGSGSSYSRGATGGASTHTLTVAQMPSHTHSVTGTAASAGIHTHDFAGHPAGTNLGYIKWNALSRSAVWYSGSISSSGAHTHSVTGTAAATGGGAPHNNMQPYIALLYCQKN